MDTPQTTGHCYRHPDARAGVRCQRCEREICGNCMVQASVGFQCPECVKADTQQIYRPGDLAPNPMVTKVLVGINAVIFVLGMVSPSLSLTRDFGLIGNVGVASDIGVDGGEWWRLVTGGFLHANLMHIGFNMFILWQIGHQLESKLGSIRFGLAYFATLFTGALGVMLLSPTSFTVGASGAVYGLFGVLVVAQLSKGLSLFESGLGGIIAINLVLTFVIPNISIGGHLGGLIGGLIAGAIIYVIGPQVGSRPDGRGPGDRLSMVLLVLLGLFAAGVSIWAAGQSGFSLGPLS